jgi:hypothetical protein
MLLLGTATPPVSVSASTTVEGHKSALLRHAAASVSATTPSCLTLAYFICFVVLFCFVDDEIIGCVRGDACTPGTSATNTMSVAQVCHTSGQQKCPVGQVCDSSGSCVDLSKLPCSSTMPCASGNPYDWRRRFIYLFIYLKHDSFRYTVASMDSVAMRR